MGGVPTVPCLPPDDRHLATLVGVHEISTSDGVDRRTYAMIAVAIASAAPPDDRPEQANERYEMANGGTTTATTTFPALLAARNDSFPPPPPHGDDEGPPPPPPPAISSSHSPPPQIQVEARVDVQLRRKPETYMI